MGPALTGPALADISAAVTPVVMISAVASLIIGINQKHTSLSDRIRSLSHEFREAGTTVERKDDIQRQIRLLDTRFNCAGIANVWLYVAVSCFIGTVLLVALTRWQPRWQASAFVLFLLGVALALGAIVVEVFEIRLSRRTVHIEIEGVLGTSAAPGSRIDAG